MNKIVVIDGLARSGTTLLSSLIHSQAVSKCYRGVFHEFHATDVGKWKRDYALYPLIKKNRKIKIVKELSKLSNFNLYLKKRLPNLGKLQNYIQINLSLKQLRDNTLNVIKRRNQTDNFKLDEWNDLIDFTNFRNFDDLDNFYQKLSTKLKANLLAFRWNQGFPYCYKWLRNKNHYWISVIRHPISRSYSDNKTFNESHKLGISYTENFASIIGSLNHPRHIKVYFDDLILNPKRVINHIFETTGIYLPNVTLDLIQQSGKEYKIESSDIITENISHTYGRKFEGFEKNKLIVDYKELPKTIVEKYKKIIKKFSIYQPYSENGRFFSNLS